MPVLFLRCLLLLAMFLVASPVLSQPSADPLIQQATKQQLAYHPYWLKLLHYRDKTWKTGNNQSEIVSPDFFLANTGNNHPDEELKATLQALLAPVGEHPDRHAQCRFVARFQWLRKMLDWRDVALPSVVCNDFARWSLNGAIDSISLVFASGYFGNPASYYGHLLLKFNSDRQVVASDLLDQSVNYGAIVPNNENPLIYISKGIFGGYRASFSDTQFYRHNHNYLETELRDLWEYPLNLSKDEVNQLVAHSWEILGQHHNYYFFKDNCAYRMADLLELIVDDPLINRQLPWSIPGSVFDHLSKIRHHGQPLAATPRQIPSRQSQFYARHDALEPPLRQRLGETIATLPAGFPSTYRSLSDTDKTAIVDTLLDYYEYRLLAENGNKELMPSKHALLQERLRLPASGNETAVHHAARAPTAGPRPGMVRIGLMHNQSIGSALTLQARPAYYDLLRQDHGQQAYAQLTMFDIALHLSEAETRLHKLDLVNVQTLNVSHTGLPGDGGAAWRLRFGLEQQDLSCTRCLIGNLEGGFGKAAAFGEHTVGYVMLDARVQTDHRHSGTLAASPSVGLLATPALRWKTSLAIGQRHYFNGEQSHRPFMRWENRFGNQREWDIRFGFERHVASQAQIAFSRYW